MFQPISPPPVCVAGRAHHLSPAVSAVKGQDNFNRCSPRELILLYSSQISCHANHAHLALLTYDFSRYLYTPLKSVKAKREKILWLGMPHKSKQILVKMKLI